MDFIFDREEYLNLEKSLRYEWLETNGIGGYANSTIVGCHTRKYHGALVAQLAKWLVTLENTKRTQEFAVLRLATRQAHLSPCKDSSMFLVAEFLCPFQYNYFKSMQI